MAGVGSVRKMGIHVLLNRLDTCHKKDGGDGLGIPVVSDGTNNPENNVLVFFFQLIYARDTIFCPAHMEYTET